MSNDLEALLADGSLDALTGTGNALDALMGTPKPEEPAEEPVKNDPFGDVAYTGNLEQDSAAELTAAQAAFRDRSKSYKRQRLVVEDSEFWVAICFTTRAEKEAFLRDHGLIQLGDKYLNGHVVDQVLRDNRGE